MSRVCLKSQGYCVRDSEELRKSAVLTAVKKYGRKGVIEYMLEFGRWEEVMLDDIVRFLKFQNNDQIEEYAAFKRKHGFNAGLRVGIEERHDLKKKINITNLKAIGYDSQQEQLVLAGHKIRELCEKTKELERELEDIACYGALKRKKCMT
tara:strand:+ start:191 stop:643 length:453 start_codon:yes stop_codon:yes gene_type:complete